MAGHDARAYGRPVGDVGVRGYRETDRAAVRRICFETGYMGDPVAWQWADRESFADLFTGWYTDHEPESALAAEVDGEVVGYLLGCRDSRRMTTAGRTVARHLVRRGLLARPGTAPVVWRSAADLARAGWQGKVSPTTEVDERWPAHLHIDLLPQARSQGLGRALITRCLEDFAAADVPGCHVDTWAENDGAVAFFRHMGFTTRGSPAPMLGLRSPDGHRHHTQRMVHSLRRPLARTSATRGEAPAPPTDEG